MVAISGGTPKRSHMHGRSGEVDRSPRVLPVLADAYAPAHQPRRAIPRARDTANSRSRVRCARPRPINGSGGCGHAGTPPTPDSRTPSADPDLHVASGRSAAGARFRVL